MEEPATVAPHLVVAARIPLLSLHLHKLFGSLYIEHFSFMVERGSEPMDTDNCFACFRLSFPMTVSIASS